MMPMRFMIACAVCCVVLVGMPVGAAAQQGVTQNMINREQPLEIEADETLEWHRDVKTFVARGDVVAAQGDMRIFADVLSADYREGGGTSMEIYKLTAEGNVRIESQGNVAIGEYAVYEVDTGLAVMTGGNLSLQAQDQVVTARDRFEYDVPGGLLKAIGDMRATRGKDMLQADEGYARFTQDGTGKRSLEKLEATGNVVITTPTEILRGQRGVYVAATNIAELIGNVTITRGPNILAGERAEVNLTTNISKMHGGVAGQGGNDGRVRGIFYPDSQKVGRPMVPEHSRRDDASGARVNDFAPLYNTVPMEQVEPAPVPEDQLSPRPILTR